MSFSAEEDSFKPWAHSQHARYQATECNDEQACDDGHADVHDDVALRSVEKLSDLRQVRYEKEVDEINVEGAHSDILKEAPQASVLGKRVLVVAKEHEYYD